MRQIIFVKYNRTRTAEFQLKTEIVQEDGKRSVEKSALSEAGREHIRSFQEKYEKYAGRIRGSASLRRNLRTTEGPSASPTFPGRP